MLLDIRDLHLEFKTFDGVAKVLSGVNLKVERGDVMALVGETGCGKSMTALSIASLIPSGSGLITQGKIFFDGEDILQKNSSELLFLQEIRNETHRFSISKQRRKELKGVAKSSLDSIELVGAERKKALLRFFGSLDQIEKASLKDLMKVRGVGKRTADIIFRNLH